MYCINDFVYCAGAYIPKFNLFPDDLAFCVGAYIPKLNFSPGETICITEYDIGWYKKILWKLTNHFSNVFLEQLKYNQS